MSEENNNPTPENLKTQESTLTLDDFEPAKDEPKKGLPNREAMQAAIEKHKPEVTYKRSAKKEETAEVPTKEEVKEQVSEDIAPPKGFNKQEIEAWKAKDITGIQKAYRRVHDESVREMNRAQSEERKAREEATKAKQEGATWRELGEKIKPYIAARGQEGVNPEKAMMEALDLIGEFKKADPSTVKAELKKIGIDLDKAGNVKNSVPHEEITHLQKRLEAIEMEKEAQKFQNFVGEFDRVFKKLGAEKNRTNDPVYPDLLPTSERANDLAKEIGTLTQDANFQKFVLRRFPDADLTVLAREAYIFAGGQVSGQAVTVTTDNQKQIEKQRRAAASTPGKPAVRADSSNLKGKLGNRAALKKAIELHQEH